MNMKNVLFACFLAASRAGDHNSGMRMRIVGGHNARPNEFPNLVLLQALDYTTNLYSNICSGTILDKYWILTAAHCIEDFDIIFPASDVVVKAGKWNINKWEPTEQTSTVASYYMHENYISSHSSPTRPCDIGLIKLGRELIFNKWVSASVLSQSTDDPTGEALIAGWGISWMRLIPYILQSLTVEIINRGICRNAVKQMLKSQHKHLYDLLVNEEHVCSGPLSGGKSACRGDSGTPLIQNKLVIGIVSLVAMPCGRMGAPTIYIKTSIYQQWINSIMYNN